MPVPSRVSKQFSKGNAAPVARTKNTVSDASDAVKMCSCFSQLLSVEAMENLEI
jgi:hypothetical protein